MSMPSYEVEINRLPGTLIDTLGVPVPPNIPPPTGQDIQSLLQSAMASVDAPMTGPNFTRSPANTLPDFDAAVMHDSRKIKVLGMST